MPEFNFNNKTSSSGRLVSLDVFRGITIAGMILVNNQGSPHAIYTQLRHAPWNEWSIADLVFPFFLFIVGVSIPIAISNRLSRGAETKNIIYHILRRSLIIFALGVFLNGFPHFYLGSLRIPGVLQRIALCYFFSSLIVLKMRPAGQWGIAIFLLAFYWAIMKMVPVPGFEDGMLTYNGNLAAYIDNLLMHGHMIEPDSDPEGLLSTIPAISTTLFGVFAGHLLMSSKKPNRTTVVLLVSGFTAIIVGLLIDISFPINKFLWSSSYAVFTAGVACACLGACYWVVDIKGCRRWGVPFVIFGMNAITLYVLSSMVDRITYVTKLTMPDGSEMRLKTYIYEKLFASWASSLNASLFYAMTVLLIWLGVMIILNRKKIIIKI